MRNWSKYPLITGSQVFATFSETRVLGFSSACSLSHMNSYYIQWSGTHDSLSFILNILEGHNDSVKAKLP